ncbi:hypothetical protein MASR2M18_18780 [Ignavibacteria bacterium]|nr:endonuclease/exonuclease/phosphatase family protein [Bacteroidota bacterium]MCZ2132258.1 endonuclease/exonuclease/phosphatase family protein [Bacteroidota bacterium]
MRATKIITQNAVYAVAFIIIFLFAGCSTSDRLTVGTFNIAWLGDGHNDREKRDEDDYRAIAGVIRDTKADIIGLEEIENIEAIERVLKYLPGYKAYIGSGGRAQNVGVLYNSTVDVRIEGEYSPIAIEAGRNRPGLVAYCRKGNFDWIMMVVHLKSTSRYDSTERLRKASYLTRSQQAEKIVFWADSIRKSSAEQDVLIVGDFNDFPLRKTNPTLLPVLADPSLEFLTMNMSSCKYENMKSIDQILVSNSAKSRFYTGSENMINFQAALPKKQAAKISDHCPVTCQFDISEPDND